MEGTSVTSRIFAVFTDILAWFGDAIETVSSIFYNPEEGLTFIGTVAVIGLGIALVTMLIAIVRSLLKGRG